MSPEIFLPRYLTRGWGEGGIHFFPFLLSPLKIANKPNYCCDWSWEEILFWSEPTLFLDSSQQLQISKILFLSHDSGYSETHLWKIAVSHTCFILVATFDTFQLFEPRPVLESERQKRPVWKKRWASKIWKVEAKGVKRLASDCGGPWRAAWQVKGNAPPRLDWAQCQNMRERNLGQEWPPPPPVIGNSVYGPQRYWLSAAFCLDYDPRIARSSPDINWWGPIC